MSFKLPKTAKRTTKPQAKKAKAVKQAKRSVATKAKKAPKAKMSFAPAVAAPKTAFAATPAFNPLAFKPTKKLFNAGANAPSAAKILFQAQKFIQQDIDSLSKELSPTLVDDIAQQGFSYSVSNEGVITAVCKKLGFDIEFKYDREFEYAEDQEEEPQDEQQQEEDEGKHAFHNITISMAKNGSVLRLGGQMHLNGDLKINTFTPYRKDGTELRTVSTEDLSDATTNAIFDALEVTALSDETCSVLLEVGRQERLKTHLEAVDFIAEFMGSADAM